MQSNADFTQRAFTGAILTGMFFASTPWLQQGEALRHHAE